MCQNVRADPWRNGLRHWPSDRDLAIHGGFNSSWAPCTRPIRGYYTCIPPGDAPLHPSRSRPGPCSCTCAVPRYYYFFHTLEAILHLPRRPMFCILRARQLDLTWDMLYEIALDKARTGAKMDGVLLPKLDNQRLQRLAQRTLSEVATIFPSFASNPSRHLHGQRQRLLLRLPTDCGNALWRGVA